jgi:hypothetical protein
MLFMYIVKTNIDDTHTYTMYELPTILNIRGNRRRRKKTLSREQNKRTKMNSNHTDSR